MAPCLMMPPCSCASAGEEAGHVLEGDERNVEGVAEADEPGALDRRVDVEHAGQHRRLVGHDPDRLPAEAGESDEQVAGVLALHLEEVAVVHHAADHVVHVVGLAGECRDDVEQGLVPAVRRVVASAAPAARRGCSTGGSRAARGCAARHCGSESWTKCATPEVPAWTSAPPSCSKRDVLVRDGLHHVRPGDEHVAHAADHEDEVGDRRGVHRAARAGAEDGGDLRDDARGQGVAEEDVGVAAERDDPLLDAGAARVVEADDRRAVPHREVHHLADLLRRGSPRATRRRR